MSPPIRSRILDTGLRAIFDVILLLSVFLLVRGHNAPGGGFAGGLVAGAAFVLLFASGGVLLVRRMLRVDPEVLLGLGLLLAGLTGVWGWVHGRAFLQSGKVAFDLPLVGEGALYSVLFFDIGVYLVVVGMVTLVLERLGAEGTELAPGEPAGDARETPR